MVRVSIGDFSNNEKPIVHKLKNKYDKMLVSRCRPAVQIYP